MRRFVFVLLLALLLFIPVYAQFNFTFDGSAPEQAVKVRACSERVDYDVANTGVFAKADPIIRDAVTVIIRHECENGFELGSYYGAWKTKQQLAAPPAATTPATPPVPPSK